MLTTKNESPAQTPILPGESAARESGGHTPDGSPSDRDPDDIEYHAPDVGAPASRIGAGTRGPAERAFIIAPRGAGATSRPSPTIYYLLPSDIDDPIELVVASGAEVLYRQSVRPPVRAGVYSFTLGEDAALKVGAVYKVSAVLSPAPDASGLSNPITSSGYLFLTKPSGAVGDARSMATAGLWYDAIDKLYNAKQADPPDRTAARQLAALMRQEQVFSGDPSPGSTPDELKMARDIEHSALAIISAAPTTAPTRSIP